MIQTIKAIFWTEYRELRPVTAIFFGIGIMTFVCLLLMYYQFSNNTQLLYADTVGWNLVVYATILSGIMFVRDVEQGSIELYRRLPIDAFQIAAGKFLYLIVSTFVLGFALFELGWLGQFFCLMFGGQGWGDLFQMSASQHLLSDLFRGLLLVVPFGVFWSTHCRNTITSLILSLLSPVVFLSLLSFKETELFLSTGLPILPMFAIILWGIVVGFALHGIRVWPYRSWHKTSPYDRDHDSNGQIHGPFMSLVLLAFRQNKTTIMFVICWALFLSLGILLQGLLMSSLPFSSDDAVFVFIPLFLLFLGTTLTSQIFCGREELENRQIFDRFGVSVSQFRWSRLTLYGGIYCAFLMILGATLFLMVVKARSNFDSPIGSPIQFVFELVGMIYQTISGTDGVWGLYHYCAAAVTFVMILVIPFLWGMWFSAFCRSRLISFILTGLFSFLTYVFLLYLPTSFKNSHDVFLPFVNWIPFWIVLMESARRLVNNRFNLPEGVRYRARHFIGVTTAALLIGLVVYPLGQILAIPKVKGSVTPNDTLFTVPSGDRFVSTNYWSLFAKARNKAQKPDIEMVKTLEDIYNLALKSFEDNSMTVTQPIWYYESQICFILYGAVDRLDKESLACASRLLERMATDRPSYDRQLMKLYSVCCQYNKNPERFESSVTFRGYRSLCWWRNIQYRNHLWNELQELTTPIQLAQKAFLAPKGRMDIDPQYIWRGYRFFKNGVSDQEYARKYSRTPSYDRMFENITLSGYHSDSGISIAETEAFRRGMLVILAIHQYQVEQGKIPESVATLVQAGYLKEIPNGPGYNQPIGLTKKLAQPFISRPVRNGMETIPPSGNVPDEIVQKPKEIKLYWHIADYTDPLWWNIQKFYYAQIYWNNFHLVLPDLSPEANKVQFEFESAQQGKNGYFSVPCVLVPTIGGTNSAIVYALPWRNRSDQ